MTEDNTHRKLLRLLLSVNSKASQGADTKAQVEEIFRKLGCEVVACDAKSPEECRELIRSYKDQIDIVVLGGGDGTLQAVAATLIETKLPLGIIPLGTANNVARSLSLPLELEAACKVIVEGKTQEMDVARVNGQLFLSVAGMGLSTRVHEEVASETKKKWGALSYLFQLFAIVTHRTPSFWATIQSEEETLRVKAVQITVCNGTFYGAFLKIHPEATLSDALLDLSVLEYKKFFWGALKALFPYVPKREERGLKLMRSKKFKIETRPPVKIDVEGIANITTPAEFSVEKSALKVRVSF